MTAQIIERIQSADNLPTLPKVAIEVLRLTQAEDVSIAQIASVIQQDPALTGKLLKVVNSSLFGMSHQISSLQQAMVVLGLRTVKVMALSFSLVETLDKSDTCLFDYAAYWRRSLSAAVAARLIAEQSNRVTADEAFVTGLLCDIGMLAAFRCARELYTPVLETHHARNNTIQAAEQEVLGVSHEAISGGLLTQWGLPEALCVAVSSHHAPIDQHGPGEPAHAGLTRMVRAAAMVADLFCSQVRASQLTVVNQKIVEGLPIEASVLQEILETLDSHVKETASLFSLDIGATHSYQDIQAEATAQLAQLTMAVELERARIAEREQAARRKVEELHDQNRELAQQATTDALTGVANRAALEQYLKEDCVKALREGTSLGVIILDLDRFKKLNDTFGHRVGDDALQRVGASLRNIADETKFAARYGGEEFAMVVAHATAQELRDLAEEIRMAIQGIRIPYGQKKIAITASCGATRTSGDGPALRPSQLVELADQCLYEAKHAGRNRVVFMEASEAERRKAHDQ